MISAVFAVIREWHTLGKKKTGETRHDMREWCQTLDWIVQNIFHAASLMDGHDAAKQRAANPSLTLLRSVAIKLNERRRLGQDIIASEIYQICVEEDIAILGLSLEE